MGKIQELVKLSKNGRWEAIDKKCLEEGFDLSLRNLGGSHSESLENQAVNRCRTKQTIIPSYSSTCDPHLKKYFKPKRAAIRKAAATENETRSKVVPHSYVLSTSQILDLKRIFYHTSIDATYTNPRVIIVTQDFVFSYRRGVDVINYHRKAHQKSLIKVASTHRLIDMLIVLDCEEEIDWPSFLLLCTINLGSSVQTRKLVSLKNSHSLYLERNKVSCEGEFAHMLVHLNGGAMVGTNTPLVSFFQNGDFYRSRGRFTSFPELVFSLYEFFTQVYISRARGRGTHMHKNFGGHTTPGNVGGPPKNYLYDKIPYSNTTDGSDVWSKLNLHWTP